MATRVVRRLFVSLTVLGVLGLALLPAEHIHAVRTEDGQHTDVIHRHVEADHEFGSTAEVDGHDDHPDEALWIDASFITPASGTHVYPVSYLLHHDRWIAQPQTACAALSFAPESVHDPPWVTWHGLRAPPTLLV